MIDRCYTIYKGNPDKSLQFTHFGLLSGRFTPAVLAIATAATI